MKSPTFKQNPTFNPVSPTGFPQHTHTTSNHPQNPHHFNSSMQVPPTYQHSSFPTGNQQNPNASMTTAPAKHFPVGNIQNQTQPFGTQNPAKIGVNNQEIRPASGQLGQQQGHQNYPWKKN